MRFLRAGRLGVLVEVDDLDTVLQVAAALRARPLPGVVDVVPAARTVLLIHDGTTTHARLSSQVETLRLEPARATGGDPVEIPVVYDGADLASVAAATGLTEAEVIERHQAADYVVAFSGFAPGFAYLVGGDPALQVARRDSPRTKVPAGSVALAGEFTGVYPRQGPGGWQLIGHTAAVLWDLSSEPPALLPPGARARFTAVPASPRHDPGLSAPVPAGLARPGSPGGGGQGAGDGIEVVRGGPLTTVQDLGRPGLAHLGVGRSGAADRPALALANRLVGNDEDAAGLEVTLGGLVLRPAADVTVAVTGAPCPVTVGDRAVAMQTPVTVAAGDLIEIGRPTNGVRTYVAVRGGIGVPQVLGSRSSDLLAGVGPPVLGDGAWLPIGVASPRPPSSDIAGDPVKPDSIVLRVLPGPRDDWFSAGALEALCGKPYEVTPRSDRVGLRLRGPALERSRPGELPSEGMVEGAVQVPPDGQPVLLLADHPVTGGYPVIAVVDAADLPRVAQARPGQPIRFRRELTD